MSDADQDTRALRIIGAGLILGPAMFLAVAIFLRSDPEGAFGKAADQPVVTWTSLFVGIAVIGTSLVLPRPKGGDMVRIRGHFIMKLAVVESGALLGAVAYLLEGETFALGISALCLAVMAGLHFPTRDRVDRLRADSA
jgi:hypothetical protein